MFELPSYFVCVQRGATNHSRPIKLEAHQGFKRKGGWITPSPFYIVPCSAQGVWYTLDRCSLRGNLFLRLFLRCLQFLQALLKFLLFLAQGGDGFFRLFAGLRLIHFLLFQSL